jgi:hypothetical protein
MDLPELALSIRQPFAWAIIDELKDIENRTWRPSHRGRIAIHASKGMTYAEYERAVEFMRVACGVRCPLPMELDRGGIIGSVELVDIVTASESPWFEGPFGLVLRDPRPCEFIPARGALGFFRWHGSNRDTAQ